MPGTVNGVDVELLLDTGATDVAIPPALARRLKLRRGPEVEIRTASDVIPGYLVTLDEVSLGPLALRRVRGSVSEHSIGDEVLLGMGFLKHFELSQRDGRLTLRAPRIGEGPIATDYVAAAAPPRTATWSVREVPESFRYTGGLKGGGSGSEDAHSRQGQRSG